MISPLYNLSILLSYRNFKPSFFLFSGRGLFWSVEFVKDKQTKEMYPSTFSFVDSIAQECIKRGGK